MRNAPPSFPYKPVFAVVALCFGAIGALSGKAVGSMPIIRDSTASLVSGTGPSGTGELSSGEKLPPDHYPLVTPEGTVPVAELALRGRMRDRGDGWYGADKVLLLDARYEDQLSDDQVEHLARAELVKPAADLTSQSETTDAVETHRDTASAPSVANVRIVDVRAALAGQEQF